MKIILGFIAFLLPLYKLQGQSYKALLHIGKYWDVNTYNLGCNRVFPNDEGLCGTARIKVEKDSIRNNHLYKVTDGVLLREDTVSKKVYRFENDSTEWLLYDFNVKVGDTLILGIYRDTCIVLDVTGTQIIVAGGISTNGGIDTYIEGIGGADIINFPSNLIEGHYSIVCVNDNGINIAGSCLLDGLLENSKQSKSIVRTFPNPSYDHVYFELPQGRAASTISIYSQEGNRVIFQSSNSTTFQIIVRDLANGLYYYTLSVENAFFSGKISVCH
jgi:hypothetical protein